MSLLNWTQIPCCVLIPSRPQGKPDVSPWLSLLAPDTKAREEASGDSLKHLPISITISPATLYHRCPEAILQVKALLYQPLDLTRQLFLCLLASRTVMDFLNESLFSFYRFHTFSTGLLGLSPGQILYHWLWFPEVSDPSLQAQWALPEIWPYFGSLCLILYTLMQSEVVRLNSLSIPPTLRSLRASKDPQLGLISSMLGNVNENSDIKEH